jgi:hypothetical protein
MLLAGDQGFQAGRPVESARARMAQVLGGSASLASGERIGDGSGALREFGTSGPIVA